MIVDDYSSDGTEDYVRSLSDSRIRYYRKMHESPGAAASRNIGFSLARGKYLVNQDDDDLSLPLRLEKLLSRISETKTDAVFGSWVWHEFNGERRIIKYPISHEKVTARFSRAIGRVGLVAGTIIAPVALLKRFGCREKFSCMEDWDMILRMYESREVTFGNVPDPLYVYRQNLQGLSYHSTRLATNMFLRACELRRRHDLPEFSSVEEYLESLNRFSPWSVRQRAMIFGKKLQLKLGLLN